MSLLNLDKLKPASDVSAITGTATFRNISGVPYAMRNDEGKPQGGITFSYHGGKFSAPFPYSDSQAMLEALGGRASVDFSEVIFEVIPRAIGREKKPGFAPLGVLVLRVGADVIYQDKIGLTAHSEASGGAAKRAS